MKCNLLKKATPLRTKIGVVATAVYLLLLSLLLYAKWPDLISLDLNELGDLAAGAFGPLAFLWLILGYMQQGDELKQNTDALRLQAEELAKNVQQQEALVALGNKQLEREKQLAQEERDRQATAARPKFELSIPSTPKIYVGMIMLDVLVENVGAVCSHVRVTTKLRSLFVQITPNPGHNQSWIVTAQAPANEPFEVFDFSIAYIDVAGHPGSQLITVNEYNDDDVKGFNVFGESERILAEQRNKVSINEDQ